MLTQEGKRKDIESSENDLEAPEFETTLSLDGLFAPFDPPQTNLVDRLRYWAEHQGDQFGFGFTSDGEDEDPNDIWATRDEGPGNCCAFSRCRNAAVSGPFYSIHPVLILSPHFLAAFLLGWWRYLPIRHDVTETWAAFRRSAMTPKRRLYFR